MEKTLLIGWDAADWRVIDPLIQAGKLPNLARMIQGGVRGNLATLSPILSPMLWTSIATGKRPYKHGVHGFSEPDPITGAIRPVSSLSRKTKAIWNILNQEEKKTITIGWWPSHPVEELSNGVMLSNDYQRSATTTRADWKVKPGTIHPPRLERLLTDLRFHPEELNVEQFLHFIPCMPDLTPEELQALEQHPRLQSLGKIIADCTTIHAAATALMQNEDWDQMCVYYDAIDHFGHGFMKFHPPQRPHISDEDFRLWSHVTEAGYILHDMMLGVLLHLAGEDTNVVLISDHGFHPDELRPTQLPREPAGPAAEHRKYGIIIASGPQFKQGSEVHGASLIDICPTLLHLQGLPVGEDMDGKVLHDLLRDYREVQTIPSWDAVEGDDGMHDPDKVISAEDAKASLDQLVALGYIEPPNADQSKALEETVRELDYNLAQAYMDGGIYTEATLILERLYENWPMEHRFGLQLISCYEACQRSAEVRALISQIIERRMQQAQQAAERLKELKLDTEAGIEAHQQQVDAMEEQERQAYLQAHQHLLTDAQPNLLALHFLDAKALASERQFTAALEKLEQLQDEAGPRLNTLLLRARIHQHLGNMQQAQEDYEQGLMLDPESAACLGGLARIALKERRHQDAIHFMTRSLSLTFHNSTGHYLLGLAYYRAGDWQTAEQCFQLALKVSPLYAAPWLMLARIAKQHQHDPGLSLALRQKAQEARTRLRELRDRKLLEATTHPVLEPPRKPMPELTGDRSALQNVPEAQIITIVSGIPRSGTSLMMQMLEAAGISPYEDGKRQADESNQRGYYEHESVTQLMHASPAQKAWVSKARGHALKVVAPVLSSLPLYDQAEGGEESQPRTALSYRVIFMERAMEEVLASQHTMLGRLGEAPIQGNPQQGYLQQVRAAKAWLKARDIPALSISFNKLCAGEQQELDALLTFLAATHQREQVRACIDSSLYRTQL